MIASIFQIDNSLNVPIYQQMVDSVRAAVRKGQLTDGAQLPTVQELSTGLNLARGTVTRAYDALEQEGLVEKVQGRGTFVRCPLDSSASRKDRAMAAIDSLLDELSDMGFSPSEMNIYVNLKLRERSEQEAVVKIALVECNPETLSQLAKQLQELPCTQLHSYLLSSVVQYPYNLDEEMDLIVTTQAHAQELTQLLPGKKRVTSVALSLTRDCLVSIIKLDRWDNVGILTQSQRFGQLLQTTCRLYCEDADVQQPLTLDREGDLERYLRDKQVLLIPEELESHCPPAVLEQLKTFPGQIIRCSYQLDNGSYLYLQEKTRRILESKRI